MECVVRAAILKRSQKLKRISNNATNRVCDQKHPFMKHHVKLAKRSDSKSESCPNTAQCKTYEPNTILNTSTSGLPSGLKKHQKPMNVREQQSWQRMLFGSYTWGFGDVPPTETTKKIPRHATLTASTIHPCSCGASSAPGATSARSTPFSKTSCRILCASSVRSLEPSPSKSW